MGLFTDGETRNVAADDVDPCVFRAGGNARSSAARQGVCG
jgi:hypothetical protein